MKTSQLAIIKGVDLFYSCVYELYCDQNKQLFHTLNSR